jgi:drug/metabolite transporter (DMT)-like permease
MSAPIPPPPKQNRLLGIGLRIGATASIGCMAAAIKLGHEAGINTPELIFYRFALGPAADARLDGVDPEFGAWRSRRPMAQIGRAALGLATMSFVFSALYYLPLAEATTIGFAAPLFSVILSALILSEAVGRHRWSAVGIGFAGVLIVMQPSGSHLPPIGLALALMAALGVATVTITIRQIGKTEGTLTTVLWFTAFSMIATGLFLPFYGEAHDARQWLILMALGLSGGPRPAVPDLVAAFRPGVGGGAVRLCAASVGGPAGLAAVGHPSAGDDLGRCFGDHRQRSLYNLSRAQARPRQGAGADILTLN